MCVPMCSKIRCAFERSIPVRGPHFEHIDPSLLTGRLPSSPLTRKQAFPCSQYGKCGVHFIGGMWQMSLGNKWWYRLSARTSNDVDSKRYVSSPGFSINIVESIVLTSHLGTSLQIDSIYCNQHRHARRLDQYLAIL